MNKFEHWSGTGILSWSEEGNDRLDESNDKDSEANKRMILSVSDGFELLVNDDGNHTTNTEHNC